jgi:hypothetical protein
MKQIQSIPTLIVKLLSDSNVLILSVFEDTGHEVGELEVTLTAGDVFGGRSYEEWRAVAVGSGSVLADWLKV